MNVAIYCADIGSVPNGRFGWARGDADDDENIERITQQGVFSGERYTKERAFMLH